MSHDDEETFDIPIELELAISSSSYAQALDECKLIENDPSALINKLVHRGRLVTITKANRKKVVSSSGHKFLLRPAAKNTAADFLLQSVYKKPLGYTVEEYLPLSDAFNRIYENLKGLDDYFIKPTGPGKTSLSGIRNKRGVVLKYDKERDTLEYVEIEYRDPLSIRGKEVFRTELDIKTGKEIGVSHKRINLANNKKTANIASIVMSKSPFIEDGKKKKDDKIRVAVEDYINEWNEKNLFHTNEIDNFVESAFETTQNDCINVYGVNVPYDIFISGKFDGSGTKFSWSDEDGKLNCPEPNFPASISSEGDLSYFQNGFLHRESGPAVQNIYDEKEEEWSLWGLRVSKEDVEHYRPEKRAIEFRNADGKIHREKGPARSYFDIDKQLLIQDYYHSGVMSYSVHKSLVDRMKEKKAKSVTTAKVKYSELSDDDVNALKAIFRENIDHLRKYEADIRKAANKAMINKGLIPDEEAKTPPVPKKRVKVKEEKMKAELDGRKVVRSAPETEGTRTNQVVNGFKFGFKKGVVNNGSNILAKKVASMTPMDGNEWFERFLQVCFLLGTAEMIERMPDGMAEKARMSEEFRLNAASLFRYISGENLGRDAVDIAANVLPLFKEVLKNVSAEEFADLAQDLSAQSEGEEGGFTETLFSNLQEEVKVEEHEEVTA